MNDETLSVELEVDGRTGVVTVEQDTTLVDVLREEFGSTAVRAGCRNGDCGTCTALVDGRCVKTCLVLAGRADGASVTTIASLGTAEHPSRVQRAFMEEYAFQCGFCLPGMLLAAEVLLAREDDPSDAQIRDALSGNLCRCTGYVNAVRAVRRAAELRD
ncbi:(2Fe-2S)-binding protein [Amycolatopsis endophytica]|uniref:Carbon-monoxide dehydrogenase small subunit n=1 Tax=Amycolatopsis endophytica TaxID=860233 RepID=A0A853B6X4_9PSEU|nr:2Fe-2S iron-sulfur cluster-binding protein [Amycolatopsis endophytica]NYI90740.1 carbon-monoxide dehydrogenase small subunit [Amycolatopsis endophytica]